MQQHFYNVSHGLMIIRNVDFICSQYSEYIARVFKDAIVAFDSYENMNTTYMIHQRQSKNRLVQMPRKRTSFWPT